jgi:hypothetical protein
LKPAHVYEVRPRKDRDDIRDKGNEANHEIRIVSEDEAQRALYFTGLVLQLIYSAPHYLKQT